MSSGDMLLDVGFGVTIILLRKTGFNYKRKGSLQK